MKYDFNQVINRKNTFSTQWDFIEDRFSKSDILPFSISDTDFKAPYRIINKLKDLAEFGVFGYSRWNQDTYRKTITNYFLNEYNTKVDDTWIVYSPSVMYSVSLLIRFLRTEERPRVFTFTPMYDAFFNVIEENGCELITSTLKKEHNTFTIDFVDLENKVKKCSIFLLCAPHNPTGKVFTRQELDRIVQICNKYEVKIISDEIHMDLTLSSQCRVPLYNVNCDKNQIYTATSGSKVFNIPGLGGSFVIIANENIRNQFLDQTRKKDFVNSANIMGMWATIVGYNECKDYIRELVQHIEDNFIVLKKFIDEHCPLIEFDIPEATYLAWLNISKLPCTQIEFQNALINQGKVGFMNGGVYGDDRFIRINCGCPSSKLIKGMEGLKVAYDTILNGS